MEYGHPRPMHLEKNIGRWLVNGVKKKLWRGFIGHVCISHQWLKKTKICFVYMCKMKQIITVDAKIPHGCSKTTFALGWWCLKAKLTLLQPGLLFFAKTNVPKCCLWQWIPHEAHRDTWRPSPNSHWAILPLPPLMLTIYWRVRGVTFSWGTSASFMRVLAALARDLALTPVPSVPANAICTVRGGGLALHWFYMHISSACLAFARLSMMQSVILIEPFPPQRESSATSFLLL